MNILLMAGTGQAREIARLLTSVEGINVISSLAGETRDPILPKGKIRIGGFGGVEGMLSYFRDENIDAVIDATHPFAAQISQNAWGATQKSGIAYLQVMRPGWTPVDGDQWTFVDTEAEVADHVKKSDVVFLATGRKTLHLFENLSDATIICRQIDPPDKPFPFPNGQFLIGRPPFSMADEINLFKSLKADVVVVKNAGGAASASKLDAARALSLPVILINRPPLLDCARVETATQAAHWATELAHG